MCRTMITDFLSLDTNVDANLLTRTILPENDLSHTIESLRAGQIRGCNLIRTCKVSRPGINDFPALSKPVLAGTLQWRRNAKL